MGPRYGVRIRKQYKNVRGNITKKHECPQCRHKAVKRISSGIWTCKHCDYTFAGAAYKPSSRTR